MDNYGLTPHSAAHQLLFKLDKSRPEQLFLASVFIALAIKLGGYAFASKVGLFFGDSLEYFASAVDGRMLFERSFIYGDILGHLFNAGMPFEAVIWLNILASSLSCGLVTLLVLTYAPHWHSGALFAGVLYSIEPLAWLYDVYLMTETVCTFFVLLTALMAVYYSRAIQAHDFQRSIIYLLCGVLSAFAAATLRTSAILVLYAAPVLPLLIFTYSIVNSRLGRVRTPSIRLIASHSALSVLMVAMLVSGYATYFKKRSGWQDLPPTTMSPTSGLFLAGFALPIMHCHDFEDTTIPWVQIYCKRLETDKTVRDPEARPFHRWAAGGLTQQLHAEWSRAGKPYYPMFTILGDAAKNAILRDPLGYAALSGHVWLTYWNNRRSHQELHLDVGNRLFPPEFSAAIKNRFNYEIGTWSTYGDTSRGAYYVAALPWYRFLLLTPLILIGLIFVAPSEKRLVVVVLAAVCILASMPSMIFNERPVFRYLHPTAPLALVSLFLFWRFVVDRRTQVGRGRAA